MNKPQTWEVIVVGGGCAGIAASVAAARNGAKTLLLERHGFLGGMATAALVHSLCGLYELRDEPGAAFANTGLAREFARRLIHSGASPGPVRMGRLDVLPHHPVGFAKIADDLVTAEPNLTIQLHTEVLACNEENGRWFLEWICRGRRGRLKAATLIDASGDAVAATLAGLAVELTPSDQLQRPAYIVGLGGMPPECLSDEGRLQLAATLVEGVRRGDLNRAVLGAHFRGTGHPFEAFCTLDLEGGDADHFYDPTDPASLTRIEITGRRLATGIINFLRAHHKGLDDCRVTHFPARAGVRESRRLVTRHQFTGEELLRSEPFEDAIGAAAWPMELRERATGPKWRFPDTGEIPQVPLRSLRPPDHDHFFIAGRCIGTTHEAQAAIRVMGTCLATGEAAGLAASLHASGNEVTAEKIHGLRERLERRPG